MENRFDTDYARAILWALQYKPVYYGTADEYKVAKNRARNKVARRQRNLNRRKTGRP